MAYALLSCYLHVCCLRMRACRCTCMWVCVCVASLGIVGLTYHRLIHYLQCLKVFPKRHLGREKMELLASQKVSNEQFYS